MKQVKISNFFASQNGEGEKRKRAATAEEPPEPLKRAKTSKGSGDSKRQRMTKNKSKPDKENGLQKITNLLAPRPHNAVLSPTKLTDNIIAVAGSSSSSSGSSPGGSQCDAGGSPWEWEEFGEPMPEPEETWESELTLSTAMRCEVVRCTFSEHPKFEQVVALRADGSEKRGVCKLRDMWTCLSLSAGDRVTVKAHDEDGEWVVNARHGYVVVHPDVMMPITTLVKGMYCLRRGVLSSLYKGRMSNGKQMLMGRIVHELLQETLRRGLSSEDELRKVLDEKITSHTYLREMYLNDLKFEDAFVEASSFVPKILRFVATYMKGEADNGRFKGRITEVLDIEELVSSPQLGIQGRVDVTVRVQSKGSRRVMPLELKTGQASFSFEHKIQVIVYTLLLDEVLRNVESGLLLYLRDGVMEEVRPDPSEVRNLLMLRNEFVKYFRDGGESCLPDPIQSSSCGSCTHSRLCMTYLRRDGLDRYPPNHPIREINTSDLKPGHVDYFFDWIRMIYLECKPEKGTTVEGLTVEHTSRVSEGFRHVFRCGRRHEDFHPGRNITIATKSRVVGRGKVADVTDETCTVLTDVELVEGEVYRLETTTSNLLQMYMTNLGYFLDGEYQRLRELVVDRVPPSSEAKIAKRILSEESVEILRHLNKEQQRAVFKTVAANEYLLIKGPPGTGKTETIVALIKFLYLQNQTILITGHTHSSVDNILLKLTGVEYLRFGSLSSVDRNIHPRCYARLIQDCKSVDDVKRLYGCRVMASTCLGLDLELLGKKTFDVCLVDESSQVMQVEAIRPLLLSRKFVLIGDSNQLPPVVKTPEARKLGMDVSIFERLESGAGGSEIVVLAQQYRMNRELNRIANDLTYGGELRCGSHEVSESTLAVRVADRRAWVREILSPDMDMSVVFVDTSAHFDEVAPGAKATSTTNSLEADIIASLVRCLTEHGAREEDIGVIAPFCDQVKLLASKVRPLSVDVSTVDQFQGRDKDVIFFSCTKHIRGDVTVAASNHVLSDRRRLTVAVTRARVKLVVLGDMKSVSAYQPIQKLISCLGEGQIIRLRNGEKDFQVDELG